MSDLLGGGFYGKTVLQGTPIVCGFYVWRFQIMWMPKWAREQPTRWHWWYHTQETIRLECGPLCADAFFLPRWLERCFFPRSLKLTR